MYRGFSFAALILIGGEGSRFQSSLPKQFHRICGKEVYLHALQTFLKIDLLDEILLVCPKEWKDKVAEDLVKFPSFIKIIEGGKTRQESSFRGISSASSDYVIIHDGVRPLVSEEILRESMEKVLEFSAINTCIPSSDTLVETKTEGFITSIPLRNHYWRGQTPQSFHRQTLLQAHQETNKTNASDDCLLWMEKGLPIAIVKGSEKNIKITSPFDLLIAESLLQSEGAFLEKENIPLKGKVYAVIGASGGIGEVLCKTLKEENAIALPLSRNSSDYPIDLQDPKTIEKAFKKIYERYGEIDGLIQSAGYLKIGTLHSLSFHDIETMVSVNLTGLIYSCKEAKIKKGGHIVNIASSAYRKGRKDLSIYSSTKAAVVNFTQALAEELPHLKINAIVPQRTRTSLRLKNFPNEDPRILLDPKEIAKMIIRLLKTSSYSGATFEVKR